MQHVRFVHDWSSFCLAASCKDVAAKNGHKAVANFLHFRRTGKFRWLIPPPSPVRKDKRLGTVLKEHAASKYYGSKNSGRSQA